MRVLLIAEACNPEWVSVPLEGWSLCKALAGLVDAHIVTQVRNRDAMVRAGLKDGFDFTAINSEPVVRPLYKIASVLRGGSGKGWTIVSAAETLGYRYFEHLVWKQFGARIRAGEFDVIHRVTPISPTTPSTLAARCRRAGARFVMGPLNGGLPWPRGFDATRRKENEWLSYVRGAYRLLPGYRATRRNATAIVIGSSETWRQMPDRYHPKSVYVPENGIEPNRFTRTRPPRTGNGPLRAVFLGRLVPYKGADMFIEAAAQLARDGKFQLEILGEGPQRPDLEALIQREQLADHVKLPGWIEHARVQDKLAESDLFVFPSIREFGGAAALEAMAVGVPPVVVDYGGPGELVTPSTGYLVPIGPREQIVQRLRATLEQIAADPGQIEQKSRAAYRRAHDLFTWPAKARQILDVYHWMTNPNLPKPAFGMPLPDLTQ